MGINRFFHNSVVAGAFVVIVIDNDDDDDYNGGVGDDANAAAAADDDDIGDNVDYNTGYLDKPPNNDSHCTVKGVMTIILSAPHAVVWLFYLGAGQESSCDQVLDCPS